MRIEIAFSSTVNAEALFETIAVFGKPDFDRGCG
jgi:hypothetical protein